MIDREAEVSHDAKTDPFTVEAKNGVSLYAWLDYPASAVGYFDDNSVYSSSWGEGTA